MNNTTPFSKNEKARVDAGPIVVGPPLGTRSFIAHVINGSASEDEKRAADHLVSSSVEARDFMFELVLGEGAD